MEQFTIEQFLPCREAELVGKSYRQPFSDPVQRYRLAEDAVAVPMLNGYCVSTANGEVLTEDIEILRKLAAEGVVPQSLKGTAALRELEQYHAMGLLTSELNRATLKEVAIPLQLFRRYDDQVCGWFSMVPGKIEIDLTNRCNLKCIHCSREAEPHSDVRDELPQASFIRLVKRAAELGVPSLTLMGGEPTIYPYFFELALLAKREGIRSLATSTNGLLVDDRRAKLMAALFSSIQVSLHGATAEVHDGIVGRKGAFAKATRAIRLFKEYGAATLNVSFSVMSVNRHQMGEVIELAQDLGATSIRFLGLTPEGRGAALPQLTQSDRQEISDFIRNCRVCAEAQAVEFAVEGGGFPIYGPFNNKAAVYGCPAGRTLLYVDAKGIARICHAVHETIGSIVERDLLDIWHDEKVRRYRRRIACNCPYTSLCAGGCLGSDEWKSKYSDVKSTFAITH